MEEITALLKELFSGVLFMGTIDGLKTVIMFVIAGTLIYLAIKKDYEPALLLPIAFGAILANLPPIIDAVTGNPTASVLGSDGFLTVLFKRGHQKRAVPDPHLHRRRCVMIDFSPLLKDPSMIFFGAAAQFGIFATFLISMLLIPTVFPQRRRDGRRPREGQPWLLRLASAIGIIGAADGPTTLYVANHFDL